MLKDKSIKIVATTVILLLFLMFAAAIYNNTGHSLYIKGEQITTVSTDQCLFSFQKPSGKAIHIIIESPSPATGIKLLDSLKDESVILLKANKGTTDSGEVLAQVWVGGKRISCLPED